MWGANTFPVRKYNSRTFHLKVRRSRLFRFFRRFPKINVGGDSARIPFVEYASRESRVALPPKGRLRQLATPLGRAARPRQQRVARPDLERTTRPRQQRAAHPHLQRTRHPRLRGLHALTFRGLRVLIFSVLHIRTLREFKVLCP